jgi:hypothetical protein
MSVRRTGSRRTRLALLAVVAMALATAIAASPVEAASSARFSSPSRNIGCTMTSTIVRCDVIRYTYHPTAKPASCHFAWGPSVQVTTTGKGRFRCVSDTVAGAPKVLAYGKSITVGRFKCTSRTTGMTCVDTRDGHGFTIARASYRFF